jgi:hypothetical protein
MPNNFRIFNIELLNTTEGFTSILEFCGLDKEKLINVDKNVGTHINQIGDTHRYTMRKLKDEFGEDF